MPGHVLRAEFGSAAKTRGGRLVTRRTLKTCFSRVRGRGCHGGNVGAEAQLFNDLLPLPRFRQNAKTDVAHVSPPRRLRLRPITMTRGGLQSNAYPPLT
jgi:hypothetical protein